MKKLSLLTILAFALILVNCKNSKDVAETKVDYKTIAAEKFGSKVQYAANEDNSLVLCFKITQAPNNGPQGVTYFVWKNESNTIIHEEKIPMGSVSWYSATQLAIYKTPGTINSDQSQDDYTNIYDVISKASILKSKLLKQESK
jgi:hypothetical protein